MSGLVVLKIFLGAAVAAIAAFVFVAQYRAGAPASQETVTHAGYTIRRWWFAIIVVVALAAFAITIPEFPYPRSATSGKHFTVIAQQYSFTLPAVVPAETPIVFDVTARDVNHGFGIYDPDGHLIGQVQAMPDYVNHLPFLFRARGRYTVRCLEFCGIGHAGMQGSFEVR